MFHDNERHVFYRYGIPGVIAFADVTEVVVTNDTGIPRIRFARPGKIPKNTEHVASVFLVTDYKLRIISYDIFPGGIDHSTILFKSDFYRTSLARMLRTLTSIRSCMALYGY